MPPELATPESTPLIRARRSRWWPFVLAGLLIASLYTANVSFCENSTLQYMDAVSLNSDMHTNLLWAKGIREHGWLDPVPYHPYADWMRPVAPYSEWVKWWGGAGIFQQSPLYAYVLAVFLHSHFTMRILQALMSIGTCVFLGLATARVAGQRAGWMAFSLAAVYAPFYVYSWPFLRDGLGWFLGAALLWTLCELSHSEWPSRRARSYAWGSGVLLGLGFLAKESYTLLIPLTWMALAALAWKRRQWSLVARVVIGTVLAISPLVLRNWLVHTPLLSSSNRFAEVFIIGNSGTLQPYVHIGQILEDTQGRPWPVIRETIARNPHGLSGWLIVQTHKLRWLMDPYEAPDNLSYYFVEHISPVVRFGLRYWMILPPAAGGLLLVVWRRDRAHTWIFFFLLVSMISLLAATPVSRYRQSLMLSFIPLAGYFLSFLIGLMAHRQYSRVVLCGVTMLLGWVLILGPLSRYPRSRYERSEEYVFSAQIFHMLGEVQQEQAMLNLIRQKFPWVLPPAEQPPPGAK